MALSSNSEWASIDGSSLKDWEWKAKGGFGQIYKARHIKWGWDVAIKVLQQYEGSSKLLLREAELMRKGGSNFVIRVQGVFRGRVADYSSIEDGLVMEFMERGSLASLQEALDVPPQKPLVFQMAHQVALGMNYLHSLTPPLLHLDLKPGNVLLDKDLNVKITDFGLSKIYSSMTTKRSSDQWPGTIKYMPPEALTSISYKAIGAYDVYSYGILLWSIVMWKEPYEDAIPARIISLIPMNQRPSLEEMNPEQDPGLEKLKELMRKCWDQEPKQRPPFRECIAVTEDLCKEHKISDAVHQVQKELAQQEDEITQSSASSNGKSMKASSRMLTEPPVIQDVVDSLTSTEMAAGTVSPNGESKKASRRVIAARPPAQAFFDGLTSAETDSEKESPKGKAIKASNHRTGPPLIRESTMESSMMLETLEELGNDDFQSFLWRLKQSENLEGHQPIPAFLLENASREKTVDLMVQKYPSDKAPKIMENVLRKINRNDLVRAKRFAKGY